MTHPQITYAESTGYGSRYDSEAAAEERDRELCRIENELHRDYATGDNRRVFNARIMTGQDSLAYEQVVRNEAIRIYNRWN